MSDIKIQKESMSDRLIEELNPLIAEHWEEVATQKEIRKLNPDWEKYQQLDRGGILHIVTIRDGEKLVGYFFAIVVPHLHYKDHITGLNDVLFLTREYRKGRLAYQLISFAEKILKDRGVSTICIHVKLSHDFGILLKRMGYIATEVNYEKVLE